MLHTYIQDQFHLVLRELVINCLDLVVCVCVCRAMKNEYITEDMMDMIDPSLMFAIPRLAIVW